VEKAFLARKKLKKKVNLKIHLGFLGKPCKRKSGKTTWEEKEGRRNQGQGKPGISSESAMKKKHRQVSKERGESIGRIRKREPSGGKRCIPEKGTRGKLLIGRGTEPLEAKKIASHGMILIGSGEKNRRKRKSQGIGVLVSPP